MSHPGLRGNRARASRARPTHRQPVTIQPRQVPTPLGPKVRSLVCADIESKSRHGAAEITDCRYLASYNLMEGLAKTILVPGRPALWTPSADTMRLRADSGPWYRDQNAATFPRYPFEPSVRSVFQMSPDFNPSTIDIVACGSTLGDLLRFVRGTDSGFSFTAEVIGQTAFFIRRHLYPTELIEDVVGFGNNFVAANTTWNHDVKGSSSHQRLVTYKLGGNTMLVRFEADGYIIDQDEDFDSDDDKHGVPVSVEAVDGDFKTMFTSQVQAASADQMTLRERGTGVPQSAVIDIKTRSERKQRDEVMADQLPRLWLRQIENIVLSFHKGGLFQPAEVEDIRPLILDWENKNQTSIARLANLIDEVKVAAMAANGQKLEIRCDDARILQFHELATAEESEWCALPEGLRQSWKEGSL